MTDLSELKKAARAAAVETRARLHSEGAGAARQAAGHLLEAIAPQRHVRWVSAYLPMRSEIDPLPAMRALHGLGYGVCAPVIVGRGAPLRFRAWTPGAAVAAGALGAPAPTDGDWVEPDVILAPLLAFDRDGWRLGYGGGYYDRTLADLRGRREITALGFAYAGQETDGVAHGATDSRLDGIVTETGMLRVS